MTFIKSIEIVNLFDPFLSDLSHTKCTFKKREQFDDGCYYQCVTCDMTNEYSGNHLFGFGGGGGFSICLNCINICHKNHEIKYVRYGSFFCDCGDPEEEKGDCCISKGIY